MNEKEQWVKTIDSAILSAWLVVAYILAVNGVFVRAPGELPLPIIAGLLTPIVVFIAAFWAVGPFREFVMSIDLKVMAGIQAWRFAGSGFIALHAYGVLPGLFAWPAGLGDMGIGLTAPLIIFALRHRPSFAADRLFQIWNLLGILDLIVAVSLGALSAVRGIGLSPEIPVFPMGVLPLVLVPTFFVPLFVMLHLAALLQARRMVVAGKACGWTEPLLRCEPLEALQ